MAICKFGDDFKGECFPGSFPSIHLRHGNQLFCIFGAIFREEVINITESYMEYLCIFDANLMN